jgi:hypothetical protein
VLNLQIGVQNPTLKLLSGIETGNGPLTSQTVDIRLLECINDNCVRFLGLEHGGEADINCI